MGGLDNLHPSFLVQDIHVLLLIGNRSDTGKYRLRIKGWKIGHAKHA